MKKIKRFPAKLWRFIIMIINDKVGLYAAQASFFISLSVIPLIMFVLTIVKYLLPFFVSEEYIITSIGNVAPPPVDSYLSAIASELFNRTSDIKVISITAVMTLWLASRGFMAISMGINNVFNKDNMPNYLYVRAVSVVYTLFFSAVLVLTIAVFGFGSKITAFISNQNNILAEIIAFVMRAKILIFTSLLSVFFAVFYRFMAKSRLSFKNQLPGALCAAIGWMIFSYAYSVYIKYFSKYTYIYGSLTALIFLLLWLYFCMNILLYGAELNKFITED